MPAMLVLNAAGPASAERVTDPGGLAARILDEARGLTSPEDCAPLDSLTRQLRGLDPAAIVGDQARIAFWLDLYNALLLHQLCLSPVRGSILRQLRLFSRVAYEVGGAPYSLNAIEHGLLRANRRPPYHPRAVLRRSDPRLRAAPSRRDPRVHFALNCGARSCPPVRVYTAAELDSQLELATRAYLQAESRVDAARRQVWLPRLMRLYRADYGDREAQLDFAARHLPELAEQRAAAGRLTVRYGRFDWAAAPGRGG
ncbi:MAG: DUF547 domain-containing protein [Solirubrobacterales bacterium]